MPEFKIDGLTELKAKFSKLEACLRADILLDAVNAGGDILKIAAMALAPRGETGDLAANIRKRKRRDTDANEAAVEVLPGKKEFYGYFVEFGTGKFFESSAARAMGLPGKGRGGTKGPSIHARPFLRPAMSNNQERIVRAVQTKIVASIDKAAR